MELEGTVRDGVIVLDRVEELKDGDRVRVTVIDSERPKSTFGERYAKFIGSIEGPSDLADQHEHYRLGTPKR